MITFSIYGVGINIDSNFFRPSDLAATFEKGVEISPFFKSMLAHLQNFTEMQILTSITKHIIIA